MLVLAVMGSAQVNYYDQSKNPITEGDCDLEALGMTLSIPASARSYEQVTIAVIYAKNWASSTSYNLYEASFAGSSLSGKKEFWILKQGGGSDFKSGGYGSPELNLLEPCSGVNRKASTYTISVRILGGTHSGWETVNTAFGSTETVKTYDYSVLASHDDSFTVDFGDVAAVASSSSGWVTAGLPFPDYTDITTYEYRGGDPFDGAEQLILTYRDKEISTYNSLVFTVLVEKKDNLGDWSLPKLKEDIKQDMKYLTNKVSSNSSKVDSPKNKWHFDLATNKRWFYPGYLLKYGKSGDKEMDAKYAAMIESPVDWKEKDGWHALEIDNIFEGYEVGGKGGRPYVARDYKGSDKSLYYYLKESGDKVMAIGIYKNYKSAKEGGFTENERVFIDQTLAGVTLQ